MAWHRNLFYIKDIFYGRQYNPFKCKNQLWESREEYLRCFLKPEVIAGICSEYRATKLDAAYDQEDQNKHRRIQCPTLVLWSDHDFSGDEPLLIWKEWAEHVSGKRMACGHFLMEESPDETLNHLLEFLNASY